MGETYPMFVPFFKYVHLTLKSWHMDCDQEGWKYFKGDWDWFFEELDSDNEIENPDAPEEVRVALKLCEDLFVLATLSNTEAPPLQLIRRVAVHKALFGSCDVSKGGFGSSFKSSNEV
eukprot:15326068-Ditylum_brightwellii.AAC.3